MKPTEYVKVQRWVVDSLLDYFSDPCHFDHDGNCQAHTIGDPCPVPSLRVAAHDAENA